MIYIMRTRFLNVMIGQSNDSFVLDLKFAL